MNKRIIGQFGALAIIMLGASCTASTAQTYAIAVSASRLYVLQTNGTSMTSTPLDASIGTSAWSRDVAMLDNNKIIVTGVNDGSSYLKVFQLTHYNGTFAATELNTISLPSVQKAGSVAVDAGGGIYAGDDSTGVAKYTYISGINGTPIVNTISSLVDGVSVNHSQFTDVATAGDKAFIVSQNEDMSPNGVSYVTMLQSGTESDTQILGESSNNPRYPVAAAALGSYAYVASKVINDSTVSGALSVYNAAAGSSGSPISLDNFIPTDVTTFSLEGVDYLALIGTSDGIPTALKATLSGGIPGPFTNAALATEVDLSAGFQCKASLDGKVLWFTQPSSGAVGMLDTSTWTYQSVNTTLGDSITALASFDVNTIPVPEPSSLVALAGLGVGTLGFLRKRKR